MATGGPCRPRRARPPRPRPCRSRAGRRRRRGRRLARGRSPRARPRAFADVEHQVPVVVHVVAARDAVQVAVAPRTGLARRAAIARVPARPAPIGTPARARAARPRPCLRDGTFLPARAQPSRTLSVPSLAPARTPHHGAPAAARDHHRAEIPPGGAEQVQSHGARRRHQLEVAAHVLDGPRPAVRGQRHDGVGGGQPSLDGRSPRHPPRPARAARARARTPPPGGRVPYCSTVLGPGACGSSRPCEWQSTRRRDRLTIAVPDGRPLAAGRGLRALRP